MEKRSTFNIQRWQTPGLCLILAAITFAVFGQTLTYGFVDYDDNIYVYGNPVIIQGLTFKGFRWAFSDHASNWHPLTWLSHMLDCQEYGLHPGGHHLTNVLLHAATAITLFLVLRQMTGALWRSFFVASVFAIHPLRVESVAWVAERKDVLSGLFFMLTIGAYVRYARHPWSWRRYGLVMILFAMGLMSKPMLVTLPLVLLLLDYWPLQRVGPQKLPGLVLEKLPLLALSAAVCVATFFAQRELIQSAELFPLPLRLSNAMVAFMVYLGQMVYPSGLAAIYPYPRHGLPPWEVVLAGTLLASLSAVAYWQRQKQPWMLMGWLWYLAMLLPVAGIIQVGNQAHADRYTYLPQIGIYVALTWLVAQFHANRAEFGGLMAGVVAVLMVCAWKQTSHWKNSEILWTRTLACTTDNDLAHFGMGNVYLKKGKMDEALSQFQTALHIRPDYPEAHSNIGYTLFKMGRVDEAISHYQIALQLQPGYADFNFGLGNVYLKMGKLDEAIACYQNALQSQPDYPDVLDNFGIALFRKGNVDEAITQYRAALQIDPNYAQAHNDLGIALFQKGNGDEAMSHFQMALQINADSTDAHINLGKALLQMGRADDAIEHYQKALQISPDSANAHYGLGNAFNQKARIPEAISQYQKALQIEPDNMEVQNNLAWLLATCPNASLRNGKKALQLAWQANELAGGRHPIILHTLAAAYAETGQFNDAIRNVQMAIELATAAGRQDLLPQLNNELKRYEAGLPLY